MKEEFKKGFQALENIEDRAHDSFHEFMDLLDALEEPEMWATQDYLTHELEEEIALIRQFTNDFEEQLKKIKGKKGEEI